MCHKLVASMDRGATNLDVLNNHVILAQLRQRGIRFFKAECFVVPSDVENRVSDLLV